MSESGGTGEPDGDCAVAIVVISKSPPMMAIHRSIARLPRGWSISAMRDRLRNRNDGAA
jgi:hypothetical protein